MVVWMFVSCRRGDRIVVAVRWAEGPGDGEVRRRRGPTARTLLVRHAFVRQNDFLGCLANWDTYVLRGGCFNFEVEGVFGTLLSVQHVCAGRGAAGYAEPDCTSNFARFPSQTLVKGDSVVEDRSTRRWMREASQARGGG
jgi:hypothetical protein